MRGAWHARQRDLLRQSGRGFEAWAVGRSLDTSFAGARHAKLQKTEAIILVWMMAFETCDSPGLGCHHPLGFPRTTTGISRTPIRFMQIAIGAWEMATVNISPSK